MKPISIQIKRLHNGHTIDLRIIARVRRERRKVIFEQIRVYGSRKVEPKRKGHRNFDLVRAPRKHLKRRTILCGLRVGASNPTRYQMRDSKEGALSRFHH